MRLEVLITLVLGIAFIASWFLIPIWALEGLNYSMRLMPWGFVTTLFNEESIIPLPLTWGIIAFTLASVITPLIHRRTVYSLYLSLVFLVLALILLVAAFIFQGRYLIFRGYTITPTPNGYDYVLIPYTVVWGVPLYLLIAFAALTVMNVATRARWLGLRRWSLATAVKEHGTLTAIRQALDRLGIPYVEAQDGIAVGDLVVKVVDGKVVLSLRNKVGDMGLNGGFEAGIEESIARVIYEAVRESLRGLVMEVVEYGEE